MSLQLLAAVALSNPVDNNVYNPSLGSMFPGYGLIESKQEMETASSFRNEYVQENFVNIGGKQRRMKFVPASSFVEESSFPLLGYRNFSTFSSK